MGLFETLGKIYDVVLDVAETMEKDAERSLSNYEHKINTAERSDRISSEKADYYRERISESRSKLHRRSDKEFEDDSSGMNKSPSDFSVGRNVLLSDAIHEAPSEPGVYILFLNGNIMKCGRAAYDRGIHWRFTQYYNLNYDTRARNGDLWAVDKKNRESITVSWQCCPPSRCNELEYKLFKKYGKGPWAKRAPLDCSSDTWELLI